MEDKTIGKELDYAFALAERLRSTANEARYFKSECTNIETQVRALLEKLRCLLRFAAPAQSFYDRPARRILTDVCKNMERAYNLVRKCKRRNVIRRLIAIITAADFRKAIGLLEASIGDLTWLANILDTYDSGSDCNDDVTLPPVASNNPILAWVWYSISSIHKAPMGEKIEAANRLASLALDNDRNKQVIVEENGVPAFLKLLNGPPEAQIAGATALYHLAGSEDRVRVMVSEMGVPIIVKVLADSPMKVQTWAAKLIARMARHDPTARDDFGRENAVRSLVTLLTFDAFSDDQVMSQVGGLTHSIRSIPSVVEINKELERNSHSNVNGSKLYKPYASSFSSFHSDGGSGKGGSNRREWENEKPEVKLELKICCAEALWMLASGSVLNSKRITDTKGLLCLAKLVEKEDGDLQFNCLMTISQITDAAESDADLRRAAFKTSSPASKAVVDQLLRLIKESDTPALQIPAIRSIGSLARTFAARETRVIEPLVKHLSNSSHEVAVEAAIALGKFACPDNFLCDAHSKTIIEFNGLVLLMRLLRESEQAHFHALILLCYLSLHAAGNSQDLEQARVLNALEGADRTVLAPHPELKELVAKAIYNINLYHPGPHSQRLVYSSKH